MGVGSGARDGGRMTGDTAAQTESRSVPAFLVRNVQELAFRIAQDPYAWQVASDLRKLGLEVALQVQPLRSPGSTGSGAVSP